MSRRQRIRIVSAFSRHGRHRFPPLHLPYEPQAPPGRDPIAELLGIEPEGVVTDEVRETLRRRALGRQWGRR